MIELDLAFDPAPGSVINGNDPDELRDWLSDSQRWIDELTAWLQIMRLRPQPACPSCVQEAELFSLGLQFTDDTTIAELNGTWRQKPEPTDVLSFAALEDAPPLGDDPCLELGDIIVSIETARRQAQEHGHDLLRELRWLVSHGFLHLLGWDHPNDEKLAAMLHCQEQLLNGSGKVRGDGETGCDTAAELTAEP